MVLFGFVLGSEAGEKPSSLSTWKKIARHPPTWRRIKHNQAVSKAEPEFCRRDEKWVTYLNLQNPCCMFNDVCFLQSCKFHYELSKRFPLWHMISVSNERWVCPKWKWIFVYEHIRFMKIHNFEINWSVLNLPANWIS